MRRAYVFLVICFLFNVNLTFEAESANRLPMDMNTNSLAVYVQNTARGTLEEAEHTISYVYTPNGTQVLVKHYVDDYDEGEVQKWIDYYSEHSPYKDAVLLSNPTTAYNCHSYAWYSQNVNSNSYWMPYPTEYYIDSSYFEVSVPRPGDIICYYDNKGTATEADDENLHSGIIDSVNSSMANNICGNSSLVYVKSKWGSQGLFYHRGDICPYVYTYGGDADYVKFYRPRTNHAFSLSSSMSGISIARTINASGPITSQYGMYELNVTTSGKYTITIESNHGLDNKLFDANMNRRYMTVAESAANRYTYVVTLTPGRYYLRTAYADASNSGTIQIRIEPHSHIYNDWTYKDHSSHIESCCCGAQGTATASHVIRQSGIVNNRATCLDCGYLLDLRNDSYIIESPDGLRYTENGSYILPNGIVVLVDEDVEAYFAGTLIFRNRNEHIGV